MVANLVVRRPLRVADVMQRNRVSLGTLIASTGLDDRVVRAIVNQHYTPSPGQRRRIAAALRVPHRRLCWGHALAVERLYGPV